MYFSNMIQNYNLFGENADLPDVVHCETIELRSSLHNWELTPHRHARLHQILLVNIGQGSVDIDGDRTDFGAGTCINIPVGIVHGFSFSPGSTGWVITLATEILDQTLQDTEGLREHLDRPLVLPECMNLKPFMEQLFSEFNANVFARAQVLRMLCGLLMGFVARKASGMDQGQPLKTHSSKLRQFLDLIEEHYRDQWPVTHYADRLAITPGHLSRICRQALGISASGVIEERIIREARRLLIYTNLPISGVAHELGYIDPAYFSRVFTRTSGNSPRKFRKNLPGNA